SVGLRDDEILFFPCRQIEGVRNGIRGPLVSPFQTLVLLLELLLLHDLPELERGVADRRNLEMIDHAALLNLLVRRLDEAEVVDPRIAGKRRDEADVGTFRRLDGTHPAVVGRVDVPYFEARALAREAARPESREATLVRDLGERVRLVHELRKLR